MVHRTELALQEALGSASRHEAAVADRERELDAANHQHRVAVQTAKRCVAACEALVVPQPSCFVTTCLCVCVCVCTVGVASVRKRIAAAMADEHDRRLTSKVFRRWSRHSAAVNQRMNLLEFARVLHRRRVKRRSVLCWKRFVRHCKVRACVYASVSVGTTVCLTGRRWCFACVLPHQVARRVLSKWLSREKALYFHQWAATVRRLAAEEHARELRRVATEATLATEAAAAETAAAKAEAQRVRLLCPPRRCFVGGVASPSFNHCTADTRRSVGCHDTSTGGNSRKRQGRPGASTSWCAVCRVVVLWHPSSAGAFAHGVLCVDD